MSRLEKIFDQQSFILGEEVLNFEQEMAQWIGVKHAITVSTGTDSLILEALKAMGVGPGDEVITTPFSFFASTGAILWVGAKPVFVDIESKSFNIDCSQISKAITSKTKCIMPVHLYGQCADMGPIMDIAQKHNLMVLEDFAQSIGAKDSGKSAGTIGHMGATSFYPTKNLGGAGEGGLITTNDEALAQKIKLMRGQYLAVSRGICTSCWDKLRMDAIQAAYLRIKLPHLCKDWMQRRENIAKTIPKPSNPDQKV